VLESKGYILPVHRILISPKIAGMLIKVNIEEGMRVTKGDVLAVLEKTEYEADVARAEAAVAQAHHRWTELQTARPEEIAAAKAEVEEAKAKLVEYEAAWKRIQELYQKKVATREQYDSEQSNVETQHKKIARLEQTYQMWARGPRQELRDSAMAQKKQAEADLVKAKWKLANCEVIAPSNGTILRKNAEEGNVVNPLAQQGSYSLCDLADLSDIEVELDVQERDVAKVFDGQRCSINTIAYPKRPYEGYVSRQMPIADRGKGSVSVRVKVIVPPGEEGIYLKPDMSAIVRFYGDISPIAPPDVTEGSKATEVSRKGVQYFAPGAQFKLTNEARDLKAYRANLKATEKRSTVK
jgi:multidrug efflux pump subunit AcrA (membrane-fusion protein)